MELEAPPLLTLHIYYQDPILTELQPSQSCPVRTMDHTCCLRRFVDPNTKSRLQCEEL